MLMVSWQEHCTEQFKFHNTFEMRLAIRFLLGSTFSDQASSTPPCFFANFCDLNIFTTLRMKDIFSDWLKDKGLFHN